MNKEELMKILPHRGNMLLVDEVITEGGKAYGKKLITGNEFFLDGHFPGDPIVPGVILCEIMAQSTCILVSNGNVSTLFTGLDKVRFRNPVRPGDVFLTECEIIKSSGHFYWATGKGTVDGKLCVTAEFSFAIYDKNGGGE
jgi:3-hydroxyacyl-[acyl-carrier-protein] dehydratase